MISMNNYTWRQQFRHLVRCRCDPRDHNGAKQDRHRYGFSGTPRSWQRLRVAVVRTWCREWIVAHRLFGNRSDRRLERVDDRDGICQCSRGRIQARNGKQSIALCLCSTSVNDVRIDSFSQDHRSLGRLATPTSIAENYSARASRRC